MFDNCYHGVLEDWKVALIARRARRMGFRDCDLDDAQQQVVLALLDFRFDETKANGASEKTVLTAVIDRQLAMIRRREERADRVKRGLAGTSLPPRVMALHGLDAVMQSLPESDRQICLELSCGRTLNQIAATMGVSWHTIQRRVKAIRQQLEREDLFYMEITES